MLVFTFYFTASFLFSSSGVTRIWLHDVSAKCMKQEERSALVFVHASVVSAHRTRQRLLSLVVCRPREEKLEGLWIRAYLEIDFCVWTWSDIRCCRIVPRAEMVEVVGMVDIVEMVEFGGGQAGKSAQGRIHERPRSGQGIVGSRSYVNQPTLLCTSNPQTSSGSTVPKPGLNESAVCRIEPVRDCDVLLWTH